MLMWTHHLSFNQLPAQCVHSIVRGNPVAPPDPEGPYLVCTDRIRGVKRHSENHSVVSSEKPRKSKYKSRLGRGCHPLLCRWRNEELDATPFERSVLRVEFFSGGELDFIEELVHCLVVGLSVEKIPVAVRPKAVTRSFFHRNRVSAHRDCPRWLFCLPRLVVYDMVVTLFDYRSGPQLLAQSVWVCTKHNCFPSMPP